MFGITKYFSNQILKPQSAGELFLNLNEKKSFVDLSKLTLHVIHVNFTKLFKGCHNIKKFSYANLMKAGF